MTKDEALKLALEALEEAKQHIWLGDEKGVAANIQCTQTIAAIKEALSKNEFNPDWDTQAVLVEEMQRMAKRIEELEAQPEQEPLKQLSQNSFMSLWQSYCDKKMEIEDLKEQLEQLTTQQKPPVLNGIDCSCGRKWRIENNVLTASEPEQSPQRKPLTDEQIGKCIDEVDATSQYGHHHFGWHLQFARAIEDAHNIKGEA